MHIQHVTDDDLYNIDYFYNNNFLETMGNTAPDGQDDVQVEFVDQDTMTRQRADAKGIPPALMGYQANKG